LAVQLALDPSLPLADRGALKPLLDQPQSPWWQRTGEHLTRCDHDQRLVLGISRMEVRRRVIDEKHLDDDPVELADPRHTTIVPRAPDDAVVVSNPVLFQPVKG
jgi:hypothetical protein